MPETPHLSTEVEERRSAPKVNVLLVDDHPANLLALEAILGNLGVNLVKAHSGEEALRRLLKEDFAVVLLDVQMQGLDGFETAKLIRCRERSARTPIIFLTAYDSNRLSTEEVYTLGAVDYLVKPLVPVILRAKVAVLIELFQKTEQVKRQGERIRQMERREFERLLAEDRTRLQESEARKTAILETALDCIITIDHQGKIIEFNPAAEKTFGYSRAEALGQEMAELIIPPALRPRHYGGLARYLSTGVGPVLNRWVEMTALRADGTEFPVELAITPISTGGSPVFTAYLRDITERKRREQRRSARLAITQTLAEAPSLREATPRILRAVCESLDWDVGALWEVDAAAGVLRCVEVWQQPAVQAPRFEATTRQRTFAPGVGLPGQVWISGKPAWIPDVVEDPSFPRAAVAAQEGLHGAFASPVVVGQDFLGVIGFFSRQIREPDADLLEMMATIGGQIGQFLERKQAEEALRESEQRFARFMQHLPGLAWIKDVQGRYVYANDAAERAFRRPRAELYGKTDEEVFPPETAARFKENDRRALASGVGVQAIEPLEQEDGILHHSLTSKFPIPGADGTAALVGGMAIDITDLRRAEEALRQSEERLRLALGAAQMGTWDWDLANGKLVWAKGLALLFGLAPDSFRGTYQGFEQCLHPDDREPLRRAVLRAREEKGTYSHEFRIVGPGGVRWVAAKGRCGYDETGRPAHMLGVVMDITERKRAEEALQSTLERLHALTAHLESVREEERARLARELHDELGQALTVLRIDLSWLKIRLERGPDSAYLFPLLEKVQTMFRLIDTTVQVMRRIATELRPGVLDALGLSAAIEWQAQDFQEHTGIRCTAELEDVELDRDRSTALFRICQEALTNVARHAGATEVCILLRQDPQYLVLQIADNGKGIADHSCLPAGSFGLLGMRERSALAGGELQVEGRPGKGTRVTVRAPLQALGKAGT